ncbi:MAG: type II toxin-antitoxin system VapC family toxin [Methylovulum sp.]|uniref:type II toxin-antitoxin system VapC family toxin n=1 Tax=Methylovulum sp. TaxID=1916980 RepID=UPI00260F2481|nr:type II toxin-antitoxin system VapC family toxin [Methylovulum sp.]MDD2722950.1 type II toxin-antitoxin system VapC family toxin [Methylovulum sp.]MDD5123263.1 type II toxin-antitoxin system VapC family toxin [Methylovulum sp.]
MNILLDTHVFLWLRTEPEKIPEQVLAAYYDINNDVYLSLASIWEMQIKHQLGKLDLEVPLKDMIEKQRANNGLQILSVEPRHIYGLAELPFHHKDPFDRIILIQAKLDGLELATADTAFCHYGVNLFWDS